MLDKSIEKKNLLSWLGIRAGAAVITGSVGFAIFTLLGLEDDLKTIAVGSFVLIGVLLITFIKERVVTFSDDLGQRYMEERTGIVKVYKNLEDCKSDMQSDFMKASDIRLLLQIGRREFGDGEPSYFWSLARKKEQAESRIRILRASKGSFFLSEDRAKLRGNRVEQWQADIRRLQEQLELLKHAYNVKIVDREHTEPYLWRIFIFDDVAYVSAYLLPRENDKRTPVYKIRKREKSLFTVFDKYFDYLWQKHNPSASVDPVVRWANWQ